MQRGFVEEGNVDIYMAIFYLLITIKYGSPEDEYIAIKSAYYANLYLLDYYVVEGVGCVG